MLAGFVAASLRGKWVAIEDRDANASTMKMHANQLTVLPETVRMLVDQQFPEWRSLPVRSIAAQGTVNAVFRIGDRLAARFPLESAEVESTRRWLKSEAEAAPGRAGGPRV